MKKIGIRETLPFIALTIVAIGSLFFPTAEVFADTSKYVTGDITWVGSGQTEPGRGIGFKAGVSGDCGAGNGNFVDGDRRRYGRDPLSDLQRFENVEVKGMNE